MSESVHIRPKHRRHAAAVLGLVALALLQVSFAAHQFQHDLDHGPGVCHVCSTYSQLEDAPLPGATTAAFLLSAGTAVSIDIDAYESTLVISAYRSRAPPYS